MLTVTSNPENWVAIHSPVEFEFQRKDITGVNATYGGASGLVKLRFNEILTVNLTGKRIYVCVDEYTGYYTVYSVYNGTTYYDIYIYASFIGNRNDGYIVSDYIRTNYRIDVEVYNDDTLITDDINFGTFANGVASTDLQEVLKDEIPQFPTSSLTTLTLADTVVSECYAYFKARVRERYTGYTGAWSSYYTFYGINAVKQNGDANGSEMVGWQPSYDTTSFPFVVTKGKFLQSFTQPIYNINKEFELDFIWQGDQLQYFPATVTYTYLDINKAVISYETQLLNMINAGKLSRLSLANCTIPAAACYVTVKMEVGDTRSEYVDADYVDADYV